MQKVLPDDNIQHGNHEPRCSHIVRRWTRQLPNTLPQHFCTIFLCHNFSNTSAKQLSTTIASHSLFQHFFNAFFQQFYNCNTLLQRSSTTFPCITTLKEFVSNTLQHCAPTTSHPTLFLNTSLHDSSVQPSSPTLLSTPFKNCFFQHSSPTLLHNARYQALDFFLHILFQAHPNHFPTVQRLVCIISNIINIQNSQLGLPDYPVPAAKTSGR